MVAGLTCGHARHPHKEKTMSLPERFTLLAKEWTEHCQRTSASSHIDDSLAHPSFHGLIELGPPAVPLIMERYTTDELCPWEFVLEEITKVKFIENRNEIIWGEVMKKRLAWWEKEQANKK
jgi:hypothetical protein